MFFLDIEIEFMNGVQVGRFIREKLQDDNTLIVYMLSLIHISEPTRPY